MIRGELRKLLQRRSTRILLVVLLLANALMVYNQQLPGTTQYFHMEAGHILSLYAALPEDADQAAASMQQRYEGLQDAAFSDEDVGILLTPDIFTEMQLFSNVLQRVEPITHYRSMLEEIDDNAETLVRSGIYAPGSFGHRNILKTQEKYRALEDIRPQLIYSGAVELLPGERVTDLFLLLLCLLVGLELIGSERFGGTMTLVKPTAKGAGRLIATKMLAGLFAVLLGTCALYGMNLLIGFIRCGAVPMHAPVQSLYGFVRSPWDISVCEYITGFFLMKFLWAASVTAMVFLSCCLGRSFFASCGIFLLLAAPSLLQPEAVFSLLYTGDTVNLFAQYRNLDVFGWPIGTFSVKIAIMLLTSIVCFVATWKLHINAAATAPARRRKKRRRACRISANLLVHEARKLLVSNGGIWVLGGLLVLQSVTYLNFDTYIHPKERMYMYYSEQISGPADEQKDAFVAQEADRFAGLYAQMEEYALALSDGSLQQEAYDVLVLGIRQQLEGEEIFLRAKNQYEQMKELGCDYVCLTGYERLLGPKGQKELTALTVKLLVALTSLHACECENNMDLILNSVPRKRACMRTKTLLALAYALTAAVIAYTPYVSAVINAFGLPDVLSDARSVPQLKIGTQTILGDLAVCAAALLCGALLTAGMISWISGRSRRTTSTILLSSALLIPPVWMLLL